MEKPECQQMKAALASWQTRVITASSDWFGSQTELMCFLRKSFYATITGVSEVLFWKAPMIKSSLAELASQSFRKSPGLCPSVLPSVCVKCKMETELPLLYNSLPPYLFRHFKNGILHQNKKSIRNLAGKKSYSQWRHCRKQRSCKYLATSQ